MPTLRSRSSRSAAGLALALAASGAAPAAAGDLDLLGTWYVLVHYQDAGTANPDAWRWDDRVWTFEKKGSRIRWTEHPIVVFNDDEGRFENLGTNRAARVLQAWEPNEAQLKEIHGGLQVNSRGMKSKSLRPARDGSGWKTVGQMSVMSASAIGYFEDWYVDDPSGEPVFTRDDILGSARAEGLEGRTRYTTEQVLAGGDELRGTFVRDGTRVGRFRMIRTGGTRGIETAAKTDSERWERGNPFGITAARLGGVTTQDLRKAAAAGELSDEDRRQVRASIREAVEQSFREQNLSPMQHRDDVARITREIEQLLLDEGKSEEEVEEILRQRYGTAGR